MKNVEKREKREKTNSSEISRPKAAVSENFEFNTFNDIGNLPSNLERSIGCCGCVNLSNSDNNTV